MRLAFQTPSRPRSLMTEFDLWDILWDIGRRDNFNNVKSMH
jgi:hypothetical protein